MDQHFKCHQCKRTYHINQLYKRQTIPGDYCRTCGPFEKCAACAELTNTNNINYKPDVQNFICTGCDEHYKEVKHYITPLRTTAKVIALKVITRKAS